MKLFKDFFPGVKADQVTSALKEEHIAIPDGFRFSDKNIIIGPNGAGKTRFLNALRDLYKKSKNTSLLYGYFPDLLSHKPPKPKDRKLRKHTLQQYRDIDNVSFEDFFQEIEAQNEKFFLRLLNPDSESEDIANSETLSLVSTFFSVLTDKEIYPMDVSSEDDGETSQVMAIRVKGQNQSPGMPLGEALEKISPGERMLFYMSIFLALQKKSRKNEVIILDEPESHLHPKALLQFIQLLTEHFSDATIWIATHSLFVLPEFEFDDIVYLENSAVQKRNSKLYQNVVTGVLGENHENVNRFFASYSQWQYYQFIDECFNVPKVVEDVNPKDEQVNIFDQALQKHAFHRVLDCGGGSGRLGLSMMEAHVSQWDNVTYDIFDKCPRYKGDAFRVYTDLGDCRSIYDCIVMMNLLHEVEPEEWPGLFHKIHDLMSADGFLLLVEVKVLREGEYPNGDGYMLLGGEEQDILFASDVKWSTIDEPQSLGFYYTRDQVENVTAETVRAAIQHLEERTWEEIIKIRNAEKERKEKEANSEPLTSEELKEKATAPRRYAFLTQQYINAKIFNDKHRTT